MESSVKQRLIEFIQSIGITIREFERECGLSNGYIKGLKHAPSVKKLDVIFVKYPQLDRNWLLTGNRLEDTSMSFYTKNPVESDSRNQFDNVKEAIQQGEIIEMMKRQMEQNEKIIEQLMKVIESNNMVIQSLQKEIENLREEDTTEVMSRTQYADFTRYKASVPGMPRKFRETLDGFEEV